MSAAARPISLVAKSNNTSSSTARPTSTSRFIRNSPSHCSLWRRPAQIQLPHLQCLLASLFVLLSDLTPLTGLAAGPPPSGHRPGAPGHGQSFGPTFNNHFQRVSYASLANVTLNGFSPLVVHQGTGSAHHHVLPDWSLRTRTPASASELWGGVEPPRILSRSHRSVVGGEVDNSRGHGEDVRWSGSGRGGDDRHGDNDNKKSSSSSSLVSGDRVSAATTKPEEGYHEEVKGPWPWAPAPIRHWWAEHHQKRSAVASDPTSSSGNQPQCLQNDPKAHHGRTFSGLTWKGEHEWAERVCSQPSLDERVKALLKESPCDQHRVCQVLSPSELRDIGSDSRCRRAVKETWFKRFHAIHKILVDFEEVFVKKFDIDQYSVMHEVKQCKVGTNERTTIEFEIPNIQTLESNISSAGSVQVAHQSKKPSIQRRLLIGSSITKSLSIAICENSSK